MKTIDAREFAEMKKDYQGFISKIGEEMPNVDATYGLRGKAAQMGDMEGGVNQFLTPLSGSILGKLGILTEGI